MVTMPSSARWLVLVGTLLLASTGCAGDPGARPDRFVGSPAASAPATEPSPTSGTTESGEPLATDLPTDAASSLAGAVERLATSAPARSDPVLGADISWPQCPRGMGIPQKRSQGMPMPLPSAEYVVIGLTNGPGFTPNPCLADQVAWARERDVRTAAYAVGSFPNPAELATHGGEGPFDGSSRLGALSNTGFQQALFNVGSMRRAGLRTPVVWVDVEPVPDFEWSADPAANAAVVQGLVRGYRSAGYRVGVYSTPYLWSVVVGDLALGLPEWRAAGQTSAAEALARCGPEWSIQGGRAVLAQWVEADRDYDVTCPGVAAELDRWFLRP